MTQYNEMKQEQSIQAELPTLRVTKALFYVRLSVLFGIFPVLSIACVPDAALEYPDPAQDFAVSERDPVIRTDAARPVQMDMELDMELDSELDVEMIELDSNLPPTLRTIRVDFIGEQQSTYNGVEPTVRGAYLWTGEAVQVDNMNKRQNLKSARGSAKRTKFFRQKLSAGSR